MSAVVAPPAVASPPPESRPSRARLETAELGMWVFLATEVLFFGGLFAAYGYGRVLYPDGWALAARRTDVVLGTINTAILLTSSVTVTIAHHTLREGHRGMLKLFLALTFLLGFTFVYLQATEYAEAYKELGLRLSTGIYGSTFFMLTGFHGLHVTIGAIMLTIIWFRVLKGHFTPQRHFAFEAVAWYWHFVDVVWLGLYVVVYWL